MLLASTTRAWLSFVCVPSCEGQTLDCMHDPKIDIDPTTPLHLKNYTVPTESSDPPRRTRSGMTPVRRRLRTGVSIGAGLALVGILAAGGLAINTGIARAETAAHETQVLQAQAAAQRVPVDKKAQDAITTANQTIAAVKDKADTAKLTSSVASLSEYKALDTATVNTRVASVQAAGTAVIAAAAEVDRKASEAAAAAQAAADAAAAQAAADALANSNTPDGARATAQSMAASEYGWGGDQFSCLSNLWQKESGWSYTAYNAGGGATGIPQSLPGSKMASAGSDWETNATTQIIWGLGYIKGSYGTPCAAWSHSQSVNWY